MTIATLLSFIAAAAIAATGDDVPRMTPCSHCRPADILGTLTLVP